jgi:ABC-type lipoprotein export system ATPase subunit
MSAAVAVDARDLFCVHRTTEGDAAALQGLTLAVATGEVVVVLGPSGAGKSTLLRVLAGIEAPSAGKAIVLGQDVGRLSPARRGALRQRRFGLVDQHHERALPAALDCRNAVALPLALRGVTARTRLARADALLERIGLADRGRARPHELSGGERQRVALCAALAHRPALLLADEPGGELDAANAAQIYALIAELARDEGATVVLVSHDATAATIADRSVRIRDGRVSDEAAGDGKESLVVGAGGWVRLPEELLRDAGVGTRLRGSAGPGEIVLRGDAPPLAAADRQAAAPPGPPVAHPQAAAPPGADRNPATATLRAVRKAFGERVVLDAYDLELAPGRLTALSGRSGSGKSTILRLLGGLERPDGGDVAIDGVTLGGLDRDALAALRRERIGIVAQDTGLLDHLAARENVALALSVRGVAHGVALERADALLGELGLAERTRQRTSRLSGGERQRVAIARALVPEPGLLLVDEPTSRLDEANAIAVAQLLSHIAREHGTTIACATHEPQLIARADVVVAL